MKLNIKIEIPQEKPDPQYLKWRDLCLSHLSEPCEYSRVKKAFEDSTDPLTRSALAKLLTHWDFLQQCTDPPQIFPDFKTFKNYPHLYRQLFIKPLNELWTSNELEVKLPLPAPFKLSLPTSVANYQFHGINTQAQIYTLSIAGQRLQLIHSNRTKGFGIDELVRVLSALPLQLLRLLVEVQLNPVPAPDDQELKGQGYDDHHRTLMAVLKKKVIIYPSSSSDSLEAIYKALFHETAHEAEELEAQNQLAYQEWRQAWKNAVKKDGNYYPTSYAKTSRDPGEDFAESFALYFLSRSTIAHQEYKLLFPNRMAFIRERYDR